MSTIRANAILDASGGNTATVNGILPGVNRGTSTSMSGSAVDFTGLPSWVKRVTLSFNSVSLSGTDSILVQLGSTTFTTTGYSSTGSFIASGVASVATSASSAGFLIALSLATRDFSGNMRILNQTGNVWTQQNGGSVAGSGGHVGGGVVTIGGVLDRVRVTVTGTDTFDAGSVNIFWE